MSAYDELGRIAGAPPFGLASESASLASELDTTREAFRVTARDVGIGGRTGIAAATSIAGAAAIAGRNAEAARHARVAIDSANAALDEARREFAHLVDLEVADDVADAMLSGGFVSMGPAGALTGAAGLTFLRAVLDNERERRATAALNRLRSSLESAADGLTKATDAMTALLDRGATPPPFPLDRPEHDMSPWELGSEWLSGKGNHRDFSEGDAFTELLRSHPFYDQLRRDLTQLARDGKLDVSFSSDDEDAVALKTSYSLRGTEGIGKFIGDYSTLLTGGATGNLAVTYLGSHDVEAKVIGQNPRGSYEVELTVVNASSLESATRVPVIGYDPWYRKSIGAIWNGIAESSVAGRRTTQTITWTETISP
ncbi:hypothetical protein [Agromyces atrinae]|uniref:Uncharacterized protein n=1 Tax=Agromyces atrinae TaxID=592376 RepID=A0A4Q2MB88_9MICO|nr:hypothetical protein [Agromyces atrinae]NYD66000.1 hypothetical protein [Agromyces atrinae]RXZ86330.1 hypothetical protein ESP50_11270 [Agromyces atrinae]